MIKPWPALCLTVFFCLISGDIGAVPPADDKALAVIKDKITESSKRAREYEQEARKLGQQITSLRQNLVQAAKKIQDAEEEIYRREDRLAFLTLQEKTHQKNLTSRYEQMARTLAAMQRLSQQPAALVVYRPEKAINSLRSAGLLKILQPELQKRAEIIQQDMADLRIVRQEISQERVELKRLLAALTVEQIDMNQLLAARRTAQKKIRQATRQERRKLKQFAAKAKNLQDLIVRIEQEAREREKAALAAARRLEDKPNKTKDKEQGGRPSKSARARLDSLPGGNMDFAKARGRLPLPVRGSIGRKFGAKTPEGLSSEGITIHTLPRAMVVSPHEGRIVFAGKFRSYGQLLIISHGPEYHTLLAGMTRLDAEVGQWVLKGEPIGQMATGSAGHATGVIVGRDLYVELRRRGKPINPLPWIMARDRKVL